MSSSIVWRLVVKDLYFMRWVSLAALGTGAGALAIMPQGRVPGYVGAVSLICTLIVLLIFLVMGPVVQERKDKVLLFILSLPVSTSQYLLAKVLSNAIAFGVPWLILTVAMFVVADQTQIPNGALPFWSAVLGYILFYYCALLAVGLLADNTAWHAGAIITGNVSVNFMIPFLLALPSIKTHIEGPTAVWTPDIIAIVVIELALAAVAVSLAVVVRSRQPDFV
jgi:ABC-2 type transport system permease protein